LLKNDVRLAIAINSSRYIRFIDAAGMGDLAPEPGAAVARQQKEL
jgi:hypothetical protein